MNKDNFWLKFVIDVSCGVARGGWCGVRGYIGFKVTNNYGKNKKDSDFQNAATSSFFGKTPNPFRWQNYD